MESKRVLNKFEIVACTYIKEMINYKLLEIEERMDKENLLNFNGDVVDRIRFYIEYITTTAERNSLFLLNKEGFKFECIFNKLRSIKNCKISCSTIYNEYDDCSIEFLVDVKKKKIGD